MKKRFKLYLETSFWRRLADDASSPRREASFALLSGFRGKIEVEVSSLVREELRHTTEAGPYKSIVRRIVAARAKNVPATPAVLRLASELLAAGGWGEGMRADMTHLACAILSGADALVTWDEADLAKPKTRDVANRLALSRNFKAPLIETPYEVMKWLEIAGWRS